MEDKQEAQGQVIVFTGAGKGKTTAALGLACRAIGHGQTVVFIHFTGKSFRDSEPSAQEKFRSMHRPGRMRRGH